MRPAILALGLLLGLSTAANSADYAGAISAYRRSQGMPVVRLDAKLNAMALQQAQAMSASGSVSHSAGGSFFTRIKPLKKQRAAENIGAGFISFAEMLKQWENSAGHRENLLMPGAKRVGVAFVDNAKSPYRRFWAMLITD
ncbi:CAP domain-containing protein [Bradyrhizobium tropiciagri]|uniref:CAP domain-containing protein n=1 Tax=Bradyrhizobium tropiciagri TaxID=312253 RepID=UPI001BAC174D|nr:CAP domain-containing protein [Bradyrhizobium tropiciagri]MBR0873600.1 CAP domain-containing protein [Bradyrhizobium tropiciagri]